ncbi:MAG: glycosyltransferase family 4 protein [Isosphaeraceae bacterium]
MSDLTEVVFLAGRLGLDDDGRPMTVLMDRLERRGVLARVICLSRGSSPGSDPRVLEFPALGHRWLKTLSIRRLHLEAGFEHPCVLHVLHEPMAAAALALADSWRLPYVQTVDDFGILERGFKLSRRWFRGLIATSPELAHELVWALGFPAERISMIAPGVSPSPAAPRSTDRKIPVIGTAGPSRESSGFAAFLEAARQVLGTGRDAEFLIASQGKDALDLRRHAQSLRIADRVSVADFAVIGPRFWTVLDIYCQPSLVPSTGRTLALALSEGVPSIATQVKGLRGLIDHGSTGLIVPPGSPDSLAAAIIELLDHPDQATLMGSRGQEATRARFDVEIEADLLASLYRRHATLSETQAPQ